MNSSTDHLHETFRDTLVRAGFRGIFLIHDDDDVSERDEKVLGYFEERGWAAFRIEPTLADATFTLARWSEEGFEIQAINENGLTLADARFTFSRQGLAWATAAVQA